MGRLPKKLRKRNIYKKRNKSQLLSAPAFAKALYPCVIPDRLGSPFRRQMDARQTTFSIFTPDLWWDDDPSCSTVDLQWDDDLRLTLTALCNHLESVCCDRRGGSIVGPLLFLVLTTLNLIAENRQSACRCVTFLLGVVVQKRW